MSEEQRKYQDSTALVVDDDTAVRLILRRMLEKLGFTVEDAADGESALRLTARQQFDLVFTDQSMPRMNGMQFMQAAREQGLRAPIIFLTATGSVSQAVEAIKNGAFEFIEKPLKVKKLEEVVHRAMEAREAPSLVLDIEMEEPVAPEDTETVSVQIEAQAPAIARSAQAVPPRHITGAVTIGRYEVINRIGRGGMGEVYRCRDPLIGREVAVKVLHVLTDVPEHAVEMSERFKREAAAAGALKHPNIVQVHDLGLDTTLGDWFIVMELVEGKGLGVVFNELGKLGVKDTLSLGFQMADALAMAHASKVVHRDIKPSNVLMMADGTAKLLDFGLAVMEGWDVTMSGRVFGSPSYMAPERISGEPGGAAVDQFSLGALLYEALNGENPFEAPTPEARLKAVLTNHPPPLSLKDPEIPQELSDAIGRMLSKNQSARFPRMDEVADIFMNLGRSRGLVLRRHIAR